MSDAPEGGNPQGGNEPNENPNAPENPKPESKGEVIFKSQEEFDKLVTSRVARAEKNALQAAQQKFADQLGVSLEKAAEIIKQANEAEEARKTTETRLQEALDTLKSESELNVGKAQQEAHDARVKLALIKAGLPKETVDNDEALSRVARLVSVPTGANLEDITADIAVMRETTFPQLFEQPKAPSTGNVPSNPSGRPSTPSLGTKQPLDVGQELAQAANAMRGVKNTTA